MCIRDRRKLEQFRPNHLQLALVRNQAIKTGLRLSTVEEFVFRLSVIFFYRATDSTTHTYVTWPPTKIPRVTSQSDRALYWTIPPHSLLLKALFLRAPLPLQRNTKP